MENEKEINLESFAKEAASLEGENLTEADSGQENAPALMEDRPPHPIALAAGAWLDTTSREMVTVRDEKGEVILELLPAQATEGNRDRWIKAASDVLYKHGGELPAWLIPYKEEIALITATVIWGWVVKSAASQLAAMKSAEKAETEAGSDTGENDGLGLGQPHDIPVRPEQ